LGIVNNIASAGGKISAATFNCGNVDSGCAQQILAAFEDFTSFGQDIVAAVGSCPIGNSGSGIFCAKDIIGGVDDLVLSAKDIDSAVDRCTPPEDFIAPPPAVGPPAANETVAPAGSGEATAPGAGGGAAADEGAAAGSGEATAPGAGGGAAADEGAAAEDAPVADQSVPELPERRRLAMQELEESWASARSRFLAQAQLPRNPVLV